MAKYYVMITWTVSVDKIEADSNEEAKELAVVEAVKILQCNTIKPVIKVYKDEEE